jgi:uncharacterized membrane protein
VAEKTFVNQKKVSGILGLDFVGVIVGIIFFCLSFTPSLLPRGFVLQGVASGLSLVTGYAVGTLISVIFHTLPSKWRFKLSKTEKTVTIIVLVLASIVFIAAGMHWQEQIRKLTEAEGEPGYYPVAVVLIAIVLSLLLIWAARGARRLGRYFGRKLNKFLPRKLAVYGGGILAVMLLIFLINGVLFKTVFGLINYSFGLANKATPAGIYQPQDDIYSGSPASLISWNTLGEKGREFVATGPSKSSIEKFAGTGQAIQPSRLYVGLESAPTINERVSLLIKELNRTDAANRKAVLIAIPTGSGGINAKAVESVEYLFHGNTTTLGIQYSYLPSWLSFLADQETARENGRILTEAVYDWWKNLPGQNKPKLLMYGESLGTLGADGAFSGPDDMQNRMAAVLLVGPPNANNLWSDIVTNRDPGSREVLPVYQQGRVVRFSDGQNPFGYPADQPWGDNRVGILQNASDPVVWASFSLFLHKPDWLKEPRGSDVLPNMRWYPFVTGWQVGLDLPFAFGATPGHGHRYGTDLAQAWISVLNMHLSSDQAAQFNQIIDAVKG